MRPRLPRLPSGLDIWTAGAAALAGLVVTGISVFLGYRSDPTRAHESVATMNDMVRSLHAWSGSALVAALAWYGSRAWLSAKDPAWAPLRAAAGSALLTAALGAFETGVILKWDQQGWEAALHVQAAASVLGIRLVDSSDPARTPLSLILAIHVAALPVMLGLAMVVGGPPTGPTRDWLRERAREAAQGWRSPAFAALAMGAAALAFPPRLGPAPIAGLHVSRPAWPFLWVVPLEEILGAYGLWALPLVLAGCAVLGWTAPRWPLRGRRFLWVVGVAAFIGLSTLGAMRFA